MTNSEYLNVAAGEVTRYRFDAMSDVKHWSAELCIQAVRRYTEDCNVAKEKPSLNGYKQWQQRVGNVPTIMTIIHTLGSWNTARTLAVQEGETLDLTPAGRSVQRKSLVECLTAITQYEEHCEKIGKRATKQGYQSWHTEHPGTPSIGPIEHFGSWSEMRSKAAMEAGKDLLTLRLHYVRDKERSR